MRSCGRNSHSLIALTSVLHTQAHEGDAGGDGGPRLVVCQVSLGRRQLQLGIVFVAAVGRLAALPDWQSAGVAAWVESARYVLKAETACDAVLQSEDYFALFGEGKSAMRIASLQNTHQE